MRSDGDSRASTGLRVAAWSGLAFMHFPILVIFLYAFNTERSAFSFPLQGFTLQWFAEAWARDDVRAAIGLSLKIASIATRRRARCDRSVAEKRQHRHPDRHDPGHAGRRRAIQARFFRQGRHHSA